MPGPDRRARTHPNNEPARATYPFHADHVKESLGEVTLCIPSRPWRLTQLLMGKLACIRSCVVGHDLALSVEFPLVDVEADGAEGAVFACQGVRRGG